MEIMRVGFGVAGAFAVAACASIHSFESTTDTPLERAIDHEVEDDSLEYEVVSSTVNGYELSLVVQQSETCWWSERSRQSSASSMQCARVTPRSMME